MISCYNIIIIIIVCSANKNIKLKKYLDKCFFVKKKMFII